IASAIGVVSDGTTYSPYGEMVTYQALASGSSLYSAAYDRDKLGRVQYRQETIAGVTTESEYAYDAAGRLTDIATGGIPIAHYDYDSNSNRIHIVSEGASIDATYDDHDRLLQ